MSLRTGSNGGIFRAKDADKRIPRNPRYADIQSKVNTGMTVDKLTLITTRQHLRRQDEPFFRLAPSELSELLMEYEQDRQEGVQDFRDHIDPDHHGPRVVEHEPDAVPTYERPYLILDVRESEDFRRCRITQARSFEARLLKQDRMTQELYMYKNKEGGLVILYSNDDRNACLAATTLTEKGFDNVFVLSGGIVTFAKDFHAYLEGEITALPSIAPVCGTRRPGGGISTSSVDSGGGNGDSSARGSSKGRLCHGGRSSGSSASFRPSEGSGVSRAAGHARRPTAGVRGGGGGFPEPRKRSDVVPPARSFASGRRDLAEAAAAASAVQRRSMERAGAGAGGSVGDISRSSVVTVADSVISRATARRGRWS